LSSTLSYEISQTEFKREAVESVRKTFGLNLGTGYVYRVSASFQTGSGWTSPFTMIYDTGAVISLVPALFADLLGVERFAPIKLSGISPDVEVGAKLTRAHLRLHDARGRTSPKIEAWIAIADKNNVPLILGLKDISETHDFRVDSKKKIFHLDFGRD
jgi:hypothetical protein